MTNTLTSQIFNLNAPYDNPFQGSGPRWLFVCSAGLLRSPTAAAVAIRHGINARSCGSSVDCALIPINANLIAWATKIFFINREAYSESLAVFANTGWEEDLEEKGVVWSIPDQYEYMNPTLVDIIERKLFD